MVGAVVVADDEDMAWWHGAGVGEGDGLFRAAVEVCPSFAGDGTKHIRADGGEAAHVVDRFPARDEGDVRAEGERACASRTVPVVAFHAARHGVARVVVVGEEASVVGNSRNGAQFHNPKHIGIPFHGVADVKAILDAAAA